MTLIAFATLTPLGISKIRATPTWSLSSVGAAVLLFMALFWLCDLKHWTGWTFPVRSAGSNTLLTYLLPDLWYFYLPGLPLELGIFGRDQSPGLHGHHPRDLVIAHEVQGSAAALELVELAHCAICFLYLQSPPPGDFAKSKLKESEFCATPLGGRMSSGVTPERRMNHGLTAGEGHASE